MILSSCSIGAIKSGGEDSYVYDLKSEYTSEEMRELAPKVVTTSHREPPVGKLAELFGKGQPPLKKVGIIIFESQIQPTRGGLAGNNQIYLSEQGKQLLTEKLSSIWEQSINIIEPSLDYVSTSKLRKSPSFHKYGMAVEDHVKSKRNSLAPDDIFFIESGKKTTTTTILNPRGMRDMSFVLVPAYDLMMGPKWSEQNKHFINDVSKELNLDAVIIVMSEVEWTAAHTDKHSGEVYPEEIKTKIKASTLIPLHRYHERLEKVNNSEKPGVTIAYRAYESLLKVPALISLPEESKNFETIEADLLSPMLKTYKDMSQMTIMQITEDLKKTW
jgi:hypothetical protein